MNPYAKFKDYKIITSIMPSKAPIPMPTNVSSPLTSKPSMVPEIQEKVLQENRLDMELNKYKKIIQEDEINKKKKQPPTEKAKDQLIEFVKESQPDKFEMFKILKEMFNPN